MKNTSNPYAAAFAAIISSTEDIVFLKDMNLRFLAVSKPCLEVLGKQRPEEVIGHTVEELMPSTPAMERYCRQELEMIRSGLDQIHETQTVPRATGLHRYASVTRILIRDDNGTPVGVLTQLRDITQQYISRQNYERTLRLLDTLPENAYAAILLDVDAWQTIGVREQSVRGYGLPSFSSLCQLDEFLLQNQVGAAVSFDLSQTGLQQAYRNGQQSLHFHCHCHLPGNVARWIQVQFQFIIRSSNKHLYVMIQVLDIDQQKRAEEEMIVAAQMDKMTMILNRETTMRRIRDVLASQPNQTHAFFMLDVDNFKMLNDTYGHQTGDQYLITLAKVLRDSFQEGDIVGRIGGDEFFVLMLDIHRPDDAVEKAQDLLLEIRRVGEHYPATPLSASIGIALFPHHGSTLEELYEKADISLYRVKRSGKNQFFMSVNQTATEHQTDGTKGGATAMTVKEFFQSQGGDYEDVIYRLHSEEIVLRFLGRFAKDPCFDTLRQAIKNKDQEAAFSSVHTFKGTCINMGLTDLADTAKQLTEAVRHSFSSEAPVLFETLEQQYSAAREAIEELTK